MLTELKVIGELTRWYLCLHSGGCMCFWLIFNIFVRDSNWISLEFFGWVSSCSSIKLFDFQKSAVYVYVNGECVNIQPRLCRHFLTKCWPSWIFLLCFLASRTCCIHRSYSPVNHSSSTRQNFRPSMASAPPSGVVSASPTNRIPSPLTGPAMSRPRQRQHGSNLYRVPTPAEIGDPSTDYQHPEFNSGSDPYVELIVSNLDYNIQPREWRKIIYATFLPHVKVFVTFIQNYVQILGACKCIGAWS